MVNEFSNLGEGQTTPSSRTSDADLLAAVRVDRLRAFEILYARHAGTVMALCLRIVNDRAVAEEIVETVFFDIWERPHRSTEPLVNRLVSQARMIAIQRRRSSPFTVVPSMPNSSRSDPGNALTETPNLRWQRVRTEKAVAQVPDDARQIMEMVCLDAWDIVEVARRLNLTPAAVRQRLVAAMRAFRDALRIVPAAAKAFDGACPPPVRLDRVRVLIVDDEPDARRALTRALQTVGAIVTAAGGVAEAMALLPQANPEVLLSDLAMPDEDGFDLIRMVRRGGRTVRELPAIAVTAYADRHTLRDTMLAGFQMHVAKPVDPTELAEVVASLTGRTGLSV